MEQLITIKYITNLLNLECANDSILQIAIMKNKLVILLTGNKILLYDTSSEQFFIKNFQEKIDLILIYYDNIFLITTSFLKLLDSFNLNTLIQWDINEELYYFCFFEEYNNLSFDIIYVNAKHELKYFSKTYLLEARTRLLYAETSKVYKLIYENGYLIWSTNFTVKVFDLQNRRMLLRKNYENIIKNLDNKNEEESGIDILLFNDHLVVNVKKKLISIFQLDNKDTNNYNEINYKKEEVAVKTTEIFRIESQKAFYIGFWINNSLTKISIVKNISLERDSVYWTCLDIYSIKEKTKIFNINFPEVCSDNDSTFNYNTNNFNLIKYSFSQKTNSVYLHNGKEIFYISLLDKVSKMLEDLKLDIINFNFIFENFNKIENLNLKAYIVNKIIKNLNFIKEDLKLIDESKIVYIINSIFSFNREKLKINNNNNKSLKIVIDSFVKTSIKFKTFELCFKWMNKQIINLTSSKVKQALVIYLINLQNFNLANDYLIKFEKFKFDNLNYLSLMNLIEKNIDDTKFNEDAIFSHALINIFQENFRLAISSLIKIKKYEEIVAILKLNLNNFKLIFEFLDLFNLFNAEQLNEIILFMCESTSIEFINKLFLNLKNFDKNSFLKLIKGIIELDKSSIFDLLVSTDIILEVLIEEQEVEILEKFIKTAKLKDFNLIEEKYFNLFKNDKKFADVLIHILNYSKKYEQIIDIQIDIKKDPEISINFIESLMVITEKEKELLYKYLTEKIKSSLFLSNAKKIYYIHMFKDTVIEDKNILIKMADESSEEDLKFILLIIEQLKLKVISNKIIFHFLYYFNLGKNLEVVNPNISEYIKTHVK